ncbi:MAG TPA: hypothetical protein VMR34_04410 [Candidatus Saccharimonadales bacterium]|nr:hypothetical protein [Candidatus Saccharimonadales bacterium]
MSNFLLRKVRLSIYFWILLAIFAVLALVIPKQTYPTGALTLFSVNSFLYGFYLAPILAAQKSRVEELHKIARSEANSIFALALGSKSLPDGLRNKLQEQLLNYLKTLNRQKKSTGGELEYENMITYCVEYKGGHKKDVDEFLDGLIANQKNRTDFAMQMHNPVFTNEWSIMFVLFSITLSFVLTIDAGNHIAYKFVAALLCTGLSMLLIILVKLSTLTHKKALGIWNPYKKLIQSRFYKIEG